MSIIKKRYDLIVVGATPAGVTCAVRAARENLSVLLVSCSAHVGGILSSGMGVLDHLYEGHRSPLETEFRNRIRQFYSDTYGPDSEQRMTVDDGPRDSWAGLRQRFSFESHVAEKVFDDMLEEAGVRVLRCHYPVSVRRSERLIEELDFESSNTGERRTVEASVFVDATYEGDLLALAGVSYRVGREALAEYGEPHAGRIFSRCVDGFFPLAAHLGELNLRCFYWGGPTFFSEGTGEGDDAIQAYGMRMRLSKEPANRRYPEEPVGYDPDRYMGLIQDEKTNWGKPYPVDGRYLLRESNDMFRVGGPVLPNDKLDWNASNLPGQNYSWPEGDRETRRGIYERHVSHALGLLYFLQNDPRVPPPVREDALQWGLALDEFQDNDNLPRELYVREARRMVGRYVLTEHDATAAPGLGGRSRMHDDSIAFFEWPMDSHDCTLERVPGSMHDGMILLTEGTKPAQMPYRVLLPQKLDNLLVPVCVSASHVAWGGLRLEPVWMHLGEVAGFAAALSVRNNTAPGLLSAEELQIAMLDHGVTLGFMNEFNQDTTEWAPWMAAAQFFSTKGFFSTYNVSPDLPLTIPVARLWARSFANLLNGACDPNQCAVLVQKRGATDGGSILVEEFCQLLENEFGVAGFTELIAPNGLDRGSGLKRGEACLLLYQYFKSVRIGNGPGQPESDTLVGKAELVVQR